MDFKAFYSKWRFYEGNEGYIRGKKGSKTVPNRDMVQKPGAFKLQYVGTNEQVADILTKPLSRMKFVYFCDKIGVVRKDFPHKEEE